MKIAVIAVIAAIGFSGAAGPAGASQTDTRRLAGRALSDVLRDLQKQGLRIVFSSELVRRDMRVDSEPVGSTPRQILDAVLRPHSLEVREGPGATLIVVRSAPRSSAAAQPTARGGVIRGVVVDARSATPLAGVMVRLAESRAQESITDSNGVFEIIGVRPGRHTVFASRVGYTLARPIVDVAPERTAELTIALSGGTATFTEEVHVTADPFRAADGAIPSASVVGSADLLELRGVLSDDPLRAVQALPAVTAVNDFRSEFSVRGSDPRHIGLTIDGMTTGWPVHAVHDDASGGSVALLNSDVVDQVTLFGGAYPQDRPARTGAWVAFDLREGSRERLQVRGALSMTSASLILEGPIGRQRRGSWLVATRQSYIQWILRRMNAGDSTAFGFTDVQAKGVFDISPTQRIDTTIVVGRSLLDLRRIDTDPNLVSHGTAAALMVTAGWRAARGSSLTTAHRLGASRHRFDNSRRDGEPLGDGHGHAFAYRGSLAWMSRPSTMLRTGVYLQHDTADYRMTSYIERWSPAAVAPRPERIEGGRTLASADVRVTQTTAGGAEFDGGALLSYATDDAVSPKPSPWLAATIPVGGTWFLRSAGGVYRQHPDLDQTASTFAGAQVGAERAQHVEVAVEYRRRSESRVQITGFGRRERDRLRLTDNEYRLVNEVLVEPSMTPTWANVLDGTTVGVEVLAQRRVSNGLSGWIAYTYSRTRYTDRGTGETFAGDFDQRHTFSAYGQYRFSPVTSTSVKLRLGSNVPIPAYLDARNSPAGEPLFVGEQRNTIRLPAYARLDWRANRAFNFDTRRLTLFVELVNVTARTNYAPAYNAMRVLSDGRAISTQQRLFPFLPTAGILVEF